MVPQSGTVLSPKSVMNFRLSGKFGQFASHLCSLYGENTRIRLYRIRAWICEVRHNLPGRNNFEASRVCQYCETMAP
jgi:hypothetical protein